MNDPAGLEHGFTLAAPPPVERNGDRLRLAMALSGDLQAQVAADGQSVLLRNQCGEPAGEAHRLGRRDGRRFRFLGCAQSSGA